MGGGGGGSNQLLMPELFFFFFFLDVKVLCLSVIEWSTATSIMHMSRAVVPVLIPQGLRSESGELCVQNNI